MTAISSTSGSAGLQALHSLQGSGRPPGGQDGGPLGAAAEALGLSQDDLMQEMSSGQSLSDIANAQGVSQDDLASAIKSSLPQEVQASGDVDSIVSSIMTQQGPPPPPGGGRGFGQPDTGISGVFGDSLTSSQQDMLDSLSSLLGTDSDSLLSQLQSGTSLTDLLSTSGATTDQLASILENGLLVDTRA
ncbi:hypothetical protein ACIB24_01285 [Spongisporangium articulatum]|uniref:Uncharacterized protein n=1 Tax=Spongisporangium articulatum TaxID=3362603 RepID=A0ABW8AH69_9ACTN